MINVYDLSNALPVAIFGMFALWAAVSPRHWFLRTAIVGAATLIPWLSVLMKSATRVANNGLDNSLSGGAALEQLAYVFSNGQTLMSVALLVAALGVSVSFWLGWFAVSRTPLRRIL